MPISSPNPTLTLTPIIQRTGQLQSPAALVWSHDVEPHIRTITDLASPPEAENKLSVEWFVWCAAAVRSRGFFDPEDGSGPYMLPAIDMLNHRREPGNATSLCVDRSMGNLVFSMVAERAVQVLARNVKPKP